MSLSRPGLGEWAKRSLPRREGCKMQRRQLKKNKEGNRRGAEPSEGRRLTPGERVWPREGGAGGRTHKTPGRGTGSRRRRAGGGGQGGRPVEGGRRLRTGRGRKGTWTACRGGWARG